MKLTFKNGQRVWWRDTVGKKSRFLTITNDVQKHLQETIRALGEDAIIEDGFLIAAVDDAGAKYEVYAHELEPAFEGSHDELIRREKDLLHDMEIAILHHLRQNGGRISLSDDDRNNCDFPVTTALCGRDGYDNVEITDVHVSPDSSTIYADGRVSGFMESGYRASSDNFSDILCFIQHVIFSNTSNQK